MFNINKDTHKQELHGVWKDFGEGSFLIAHTNNLVFQREFNRLQAPHRKKIDKGTLDPKISLDLLTKAMAKGILLDWKNVGAEEAVIAYDQEKAATVLRLNSELREFIQEVALDLDQFKTEEEEVAGEL